ncbi:hypothetical protein ACFLWH_00865 [Chloroflexota bacterium]
MNKKIINKLYWNFWGFTTIFIGILAGFMVSHSLQLGRFFTWLIESGDDGLLCQRSYQRFKPDVFTLDFLYFSPGSIPGFIW